MITGNKLQGTIPSDLFVNFGAPLAFTSLEFDVSNNQLTGSIPELFKVANLSVSILTLNFGRNQLSGSLPVDFFSDRQVSLITVDFSSNSISGTIPEEFATKQTKYCPQLFSLNFARNDLSGEAPSFFNNVTQCLGWITTVSLDYSYNQLTSIAPNFLPRNESHAPRNSLTVNLSHNQITGSLNEFSFAPVCQLAQLDLSFNQINNGSRGISVTSLFEPLMNSSFTLYQFVLNLNDNAFRGALNLTGLTSEQRDAFQSRAQSSGVVQVSMSGNAISSINIDDSWSNSIYSIDVSRNPRLTGGGFPDSLFNATSLVRTIYAAGTALRGNFPDMAILKPKYLTRIDFSDNYGIDFCSESRSNWTATLVVCLFKHTNASSCNGTYPVSCIISEPLPVAPLPPAESPYEDTNPIDSTTPGTPDMPNALPESPNAHPEDSAPESPNAHPEDSAPAGSPYATPTYSPNALPTSPTAQPAPISTATPARVFSSGNVITILLLLIVLVMTN